jgi:hypothetical protein
MAKHYTLLLLSIFFGVLMGFAQEPEYLTVADFDLNGHVKSCKVITDYGSEVFEFDTLGRLIKNTTQYNKEDQDITVYKYDNDFLVERRMESYKNGQLDAATSLANFFELDTTGNKSINEKVISYDKQFVEQQQFRYDEANKLIGITISHLNAVDETTVEYAGYKNETTVTYFLNGVIQKSIRTSKAQQGADGQEIKTVLTKEFLDGQPNSAVEETYDAKGHLLTNTFFVFDSSLDEFEVSEQNTNVYNEEGVLSKTLFKKGNSVLEKEFIFQFDDNPEKNWVKKIVTPDNTFITRKIEYYPSDAEEPKLD